MAKANVVVSTSRNTVVGRENPIGRYSFSVYSSSRGAIGDRQGSEVSVSAERTEKRSENFTVFLDAEATKALASKLAEIAGMKLVSKETETETA